MDLPAHEVLPLSDGPLQLVAGYPAPVDSLTAVHIQATLNNHKVRGRREKRNERTRSWEGKERKG